MTVRRRVTVKLEAIDALHQGHRRRLLGRGDRALHRGQRLGLAAGATVERFFLSCEIQGVRCSDLLEWTAALARRVAVFDAVAVVLPLALWRGWALVETVLCGFEERRLWRLELELEVGRRERHGARRARSCQ